MDYYFIRKTKWLLLDNSKTSLKKQNGWVHERERGGEDNCGNIHCARHDNFRAKGGSAQAHGEGKCRALQKRARSDDIYCLASCCHMHWGSCLAILCGRRSSVVYWLGLQWL